MANRLEDFPFEYWDRDTSVIFRKTNEEFGGLSNMAAGYPLEICGKVWRTSEALYQALRFPDFIDVQQKIYVQASPMAAKMVSKPHRLSESRSDWDEFRVEIMFWCLEVKLFQHQEKFGELLRRTGTRDIVESSSKDKFWGAIEQNSGSLHGQNVLGRLLMRLRSNAKSSAWEGSRPTDTSTELRLFGKTLKSAELSNHVFDGTLGL